MKSRATFLSALRRVRVTPRVLLLLIVLLAFALRVFRLGAQAIWWDESLTVYRATRDLGTIFANTIQIQNVLTTDLQPPLYFFFEYFFVRAFGLTEFAVRVLTAFAGTASVPLLYALGARVFNARVGRVAAFLAALSPFYVAYAQEARPYALVLFFVLLAVYTLARAFSPRVIAQSANETSAFSSRVIARNASETSAFSSHVIASEAKQSPNSKSNLGIASGKLRPRNDVNHFWLSIFGFILSAAAALYSHYYAIFLFPFYVALIALYSWNSSRAKLWLLLPALPFASIIFLFPIILRGAAGNVLSGPSSVSLDIILFDLLNSFSVGISADARDLGWIDAAMLTLFAFGIFFATPRFQISKERKVPFAFRNSIILLAFLVIPLTALQLATLYRPLYQNSRYFIALSPAFYLGVAAGIAALAEKFKLAAVAALAIFLLGAGISLNNLFFVPRYGKDDHRAWTDYLRARVRPGDVLILNSPHTEALFNYYARDLLPYTTLPILRADAAPFDEMENRNAVRDLVRAYPRVWYLALHVPFDDPDARIEKFLDAEGVRIERTNFPGVSTAISLSQFLPALPVLRDRADIARPVNFLFGASLRLVGFDAPAQIESGARAIVKLDWQLDQPVGEDFGASLRVVDNAGAVWGEWDSPPLGNVAGTSTLPAQIILVDAHDLPIALGAVPGTYQLFLSVYRAATGEIIGTEKLSDLAITRPRVALDPAAVRATARVDYTAGAVRIIGADFPTRAVRPGDSISVSIYFQILQKPRADISVILQVAQRAFPFIGAWTLRAEARAQLSREVETSDLVRQDFSARIPPDASGEIFLRALVADSTVELGSVRVAEIARTTIAPTIAHQLSARFGDSIELLGYDLTPTRARAGETIRLILYWRALNPMSTSYTVFAHLLDNKNQIVGQQDSIPASGARPTTSWVAGEVIADEYYLQLNDNALRGNYQIEIGWYDAATRARLPVASRGAETSDHLLLSEIEVP